MSNFDLQIKNYTISELQEIFGLTDKYQLRELEEKGQKLVQNIQSDSEISQDVRQKTLDFLSEAKDKLISESMPNLSVVDIKAQPQRVAENIYQSEHPSNYFPPMIGLYLWSHLYTLEHVLQT